MADTNFNYSTRAFQQHAEHPGFWHYAQRTRNGSYRFEIRLDSATLQREPIAA